MSDLPPPFDGSDVNSSNFPRVQLSHTTWRIEVDRGKESGMWSVSVSLGMERPRMSSHSATPRVLFEVNGRMSSDISDLRCDEATSSLLRRMASMITSNWQELGFSLNTDST